MTSELKRRQRAESQGQKGAGTAATDDKKESKSINKKDDLDKVMGSSTHRVWTRSVVILCVMTVVYFYGKFKASTETQFALVRENLPLRMQKFQCSESYEQDLKKYPKCVTQKCGRFVTDQLVTLMEVETLLDLAKKLMAKSKSSGGASILDLHSGAMSHGEKFINVYSNPELVSLIRPDHLAVYKLVRGKIKQAIAQQFGVQSEGLYLTHPTFFSRLTNATAKTEHDEYWHEHIDKETYPSFHFTSLLYLSTYNRHFKGGRFIFVDGKGTNKTTSAIEPKKMRLSAFTSGAENVHHVEKVTEGERYAITISFTCDKNFAINDPQLKSSTKVKK